MSSAMPRLGKGSRPLLARSALSSLMLLSATSFAGCDSFTSDGTPRGGDLSGTGGAGSGGGATVGAAGIAASPGIFLGPPKATCQLPKGDVPVFADRVVWNNAPARRELFTWTTAEQVKELRAGS